MAQIGWSDLDIPEIFFLLDDEKIMLSSEFGDERDLGNHLVYWVSAHEDLTWPILVTLLIPGTEMKPTSAPGQVFL